MGVVLWVVSDACHARVVTVAALGGGRWSGPGMPVVVDVGLLQVLLVLVFVGLVAVLDRGVVVLVGVAGEQMLPGRAVPQVVGHVQVLVVVHGRLVAVGFQALLLHGGAAPL